MKDVEWVFPSCTRNFRCVFVIFTISIQCTFRSPFNEHYVFLVLRDSLLAVSDIEGPAQLYSVKC